MCTLHVFNGNCAETKDRHITQIIRDWNSNPDGGSVCCLDDHDDIVVRVQTIKLKYLVNVIKSSSFARYVVHLRASTTHTTGVSGCHMFDSPSGQYVYCHNGVINAGIRHRVDSLLLGEELDGESGYGLPDWSHHQFANVIVIDQYQGELFVHRSKHGRLTHDGLGNWSTNGISDRYIECVPGWYTINGKLIHSYSDTVNRHLMRAERCVDCDCAVFNADTGNSWPDDAIETQWGTMCRECVDALSKSIQFETERKGKETT